MPGGPSDEPETCCFPFHSVFGRRRGSRLLTESHAAEQSALTACPFDTSLDAEREALFSVKQGLMPVIYGPSAKGALALWVADMDLPC